MIRAIPTFLFISLSITLNAAEQPKKDGELARWEFDNSTDGWKAANQSKISASDGALTVLMTGRDPFLTVSVDAPAGWKELSFRAKYRGRSEGQVFWTTTKDKGTSEQRSAKFFIRSRDEDWHTYRVYFHPDANLTSIRLDPNNRKGRMVFDWVALSSRQPPLPSATPVDQLKLLPGFKAELLYSVPSRSQGSWVSLAVDDRGRLITSDQYGKLYRVTPPAIGSEGEVQIEPIELEIGMAQGLLYAFDSLYVVVNGKGPGLYRVRDTNGDDKFDEVKLLRAFEGTSEHGPHAVILSPDKKSLYVCGGNHTKLPELHKSRVPRNWKEDLLLGRQWDAGGHAVGRMAPGGWICNTDPDGKQFELISSGYRNEYDIAFNKEGELFTYDADMEWDVGLPWYRPTRVNHATSGSEFGWRSGTGKWPEYYPDSLPSVVDIGPGSPTGIVFGYGTKFPAKYQNALFICDWSYGVVYAVHLEESGASYIGTTERFVSAAPLPATDIVINPHDGAMYFTIGGRRTQSGLYRITYNGKESAKKAKKPSAEFARLRKLRRELEAYHGTKNPKSVDKVWQHLSHTDRHIRYAARVAIEHLPVDKWRKKVVTEKNQIATIEAAIALARNGVPSDQAALIQSLGRVDWSELNEEQRLSLIRATCLALVRLGEPSGNSRSIILKQFDQNYPAKSQRLNRELCLLLVYLKAPGVVNRTIELLENAPTQEEQIHYALCLRNLKEDWTEKSRERYFKWFLNAARHRGGHSFSGFLANIRNEAIASLSDEHKKSLDALLKEEPNPAEPVVQVPRKFVKKWTVDELLPELEAGLVGRDFVNGRQMFAATQCFKCHRFGGEGGTVGPDLTAVGRRFNARSLLESLIEPSKVISDQYQATVFQLDDGRTVSGRVVNLSEQTLMISENMLNPGKLRSINRDEIEAMRPSPTSQMPESLLDTLNREAVLDLLAYLRSGGNPDHESFRE